MKASKSRSSSKGAVSLDFLEQKLLETRVEQKLINTITFVLEGVWVDHKKVLEYVRNFGPKALKLVSTKPRDYYDDCPAVMYRKTTEGLQVSTSALNEKYTIKLHDKEIGLVQEIDRRKKAAKSRKRKLDAEARIKHEAARKRGKTEEITGEHVKSLVLGQCCSIYSDSEFVNEIGVLNKTVKVKLDMSTLRSECIEMVFPIRCWVNAEEMSLEPEEVQKYCTMDISEDESDQEEVITLSDKSEWESCVTFNICRLYRRKKAKAAYEIGSFHPGVPLRYSKKESGGGWFKILKPLNGWIQYSELLPNELTEEELKKIEELKKSKEAAIDLTDESKSVSKDEKEETVKPDGKAVASEDKKVEGEKANSEEEVTKVKGQSDKSEDLVNGSEIMVSADGSSGSENPLDVDNEVKDVEESGKTKTKKKVSKNKVAMEETDTIASSQELDTSTESTSDKRKKNVPEKQSKSSVGTTASGSIKIDSDVEIVFTDDDWSDVENTEEETLSGNWCCGQQGGCFTLQQKANGILDGYLEKKETCSIDGKVDGENVQFNQNWQRGSVHGLGVVTKVKGTHCDGMRTMKVQFVFTNKKGKKISGKNVMFKEPSCNISGVWYSEDHTLGSFTIKMSERGTITGFVDNQTSCKISGRISAHHIKFKQLWQAKPIKGSNIEDEHLVTSVEGFVNKTATKMSLNYSHPMPDGTVVTGKTVLRKRTVRALAGLWVSGDQGGRFIFKEGKGQNFDGYLESDDTCRIENGVVDAFTVTFRQVWLSGSAHKGAVATVKGKADVAFTKLALSYCCTKQGGKEIKGKSVLNKLEAGDKVVLNNTCFTGTHCAFPANVFRQFEGFKLFSHHSGENRFPIYTRTQKIIILGEADFSFTLAMMRAFKRSFSTIVGTSYMLKWGLGKPPPSWNSNPRKRQFLNESVRKLDPTLDEIIERGGYCRFGVDARNLETTLFGDKHVGKWCGDIPKSKFDRIVFPFPRASLTRFDRVADTDLIRGTFRSAQKMLVPNGELHLILHTSRQGVAQFDLWSIRALAETEDLVWRAAIPFDPGKMPAYNPKDVTGKPWRPYEPRIHVFTSRFSAWVPKARAWRH